MTDKVSREVKYINKDFAELRKALINHTKNYFPNTYSDFNESSPGMMFLEMAAYVGDVLSFYSDVQLQESFLYTVDERMNLYNLAQSLGYKPKTITPANVEIEVMQLIPSIGEGTAVRPDFNYALAIEKNMQVRTNDNVSFYTIDPVDFRYSSSFDPTNVSVYSVTNDGHVEYFLLKKTVKAISGEIRTATFGFQDPKIYDKIVINDNNVVGVSSIIDSDNNTWYEVPYLAQELVPISIRNTAYNDPVLSQYNADTPYILSYRLTERRFVTRYRKDDRLEIQFGAGLSKEADEEIVPNPYNVALGLDYFRRSVDTSVDPMNFLYTKTYGSAPNNTTLTVTYAVANGLADNVNANTITNIASRTFLTGPNVLDPTVVQTIQASLTVNNPKPAFGGVTRPDLEVVRQEAIANFAAQNRTVTKEDYIVRCFTMPAKYGAISKVHVQQDTQIDYFGSYEGSRIANPMALNLYVLGYNASKQLVNINQATKENLRNYLSMHRMMTDAINIKDPYIVNIGIDYEIITRPSYNSNEVLLKCHERLMQLFEPDKIQINQPILISKLVTELDKVEGVQTVQSVKITNLFDPLQGYNTNVYDIDTATRNNIVYPSLDPMIFEVKFPKKDIRGRVEDL